MSALRLRSKIPPDLAWRVSKDAALLYVYALAEANDGGVCEQARSVACHASFGRDEQDRAVAELVAAGYVKERHERVVIAEFPGQGCVYGSRLDLVICNYVAPLFAERLSADGWARLRKLVFERDDFTCQYCDQRGGQLECDHVEPISRGGTNEIGNLVTACSDCNRSKRSKQLDQWRQREST